MRIRTCDHQTRIWFVFVLISASQIGISHGNLHVWTSSGRMHSVCCKLRQAHILCKDETYKVNRAEPTAQTLPLLTRSSKSTSMLISLALRCLQNICHYLETNSEILISPISLATSATPTDLASVSSQGSTLDATPPEIPDCITTRFGPSLRSGSTSIVHS